MYATKTYMNVNKQCMNVLVINIDINYVEQQKIIMFVVVFYKFKTHGAHNNNNKYVIHKSIIV